MEPGTGQITLEWAEAAAAIARRAGPRPCVIGVTGPQGSGKTTLAQAVAGLVTPSVVLSTDRYLPDYAGLERHAYDLPEHADLPRLASDIAALRDRGAADVPVWSFKTHARAGYEALRVGTAGVVFVEGIHALTEPVRGLLELAVFVESRATVRLGRVVAREKDRGWSEAEAEAFMREVADPVFERFAAEYRAAADVVVVNG